MDGKELNGVLAKHTKWLHAEDGGERANLRYANLRRANLRYANLRYANLSGAYLSGADLSGADLSGADLSDADLSGADLSYAYLSDADLRRANLSDADLRYANLSGADLSECHLPHFQLNEHADLRVYKKVDGKIVHLLIPRGVKRTASLIGRKCRAEKAFVLAIQGDDPVTTRGLTYEIGKWVYPDSYDDDPRVECTHGIHFFMTRAEAEEY